MIVMALVLGACGTPSASPDQLKAVKTTVQKYAYEAYPEWAVANPAKECPAALVDLDQYINRTDIKDPWGHDFKMMCGAAVPAGAKGLAVLSFGPDGKEGTADDIKSS
jgi:Type II secretion system (T2SS), protein G